MGERKLQTLLREARRVFLGACCALGGLAGLWSGIWSAPPVPGRGDLTAELGGLLGAVLERFALGLGTGAAIGLLVCLTILRPRA